MKLSWGEQGGWVQGIFKEKARMNLGTVVSDGENEVFTNLSPSTKVNCYDSNATQ